MDHAQSLKELFYNESAKQILEGTEFDNTLQLTSPTTAQSF